MGIKAFIRNDQGQVLLLRVSLEAAVGRSYWDLPGGRMHRGESVEAALKREVQEEIALPDLEIGRHLGMVLTKVRIFLPAGGDVGLLLSVYECRIPDGIELSLAGEHTDRKWCTPVEAANLLATKFPPEFCQQIAAL